MAQSAAAARYPLLWATYVYAAGILLGAWMWRSPLWWLAAIVIFMLAASVFLPRRPSLASALALGGLLAASALNLQTRPLKTAPLENDSRFAQLADGREVLIVAHVIRDGIIRPSNPRYSANSDANSDPASDKVPMALGDQAQSVDVETESAQDADLEPEAGAAARPSDMRFAIRLNIYSPAVHPADVHSAHSAMPQFIYGQLFRFAAKLRRPRNFGNPGAFDYHGFLAQQGIVALASVRSDRIELLPGFGGTRLESLRSALRRSLLRKINLLWNAQDSALISAMLLGDRSGVDRETTLDYQRTGAYHILVVAGLKVGILAFSLLWLLRRARVNPWLATLITVSVISVYAMVAEANPPVVRATLMLVLYLLARLLYRERNPMNAIGVAGLAMLVFNPRALFDPGFQMTFLAMLAIGGIAIPLLERTAEPYRRALRYLDSVDYDSALAPRLAQFRLDLRMIARRASYFIGLRPAMWTITLCGRLLLAAFEIVVLSAILQLALALPMGFYFHRAIALGVPANAIAVPLHSLLLPAAALAVGVSYISLVLAHIPAMAAAGLLHATNLAVERLAHWHGMGIAVANLRVATPGIMICLLAAGAFAFAMFASSRRRLVAAASLLALLGAAVLIALPPRPQVMPGVLEMTAIDVGQGDSILVVSPQGRTLLVDGGGPLGETTDLSRFDFGEDVVSPYLWSRGITRLDVVALTHAHSDHIGGLAAIMENFRPRQFWVGPVPSSPAVIGLWDQAQQEDIAIIRRRQGDTLDFGGAKIRILAPPRAWDSESGSPGKSENNQSLVMKVSYGKTSALLEGDAEKNVERLLAEDPGSAADVLKVGHHGSNTSTIPELLQSVHPRFAVISVGFHSPFGHPRPQVLTRLRQAGVATFRTDTMGAVSFYLDGAKVTGGPVTAP